MDADEKGWTLMGPPISTDYTDFLCRGKACLALLPPRPLWLRVRPSAEQRAASTASSSGETRLAALG